MRHSGLALLVLGAIIAVIGVLQTTDATQALCPDGTELIAKYEYGGRYAAESGGSVVAITNGDAEGGQFSSTTPISAVVVKGGTDAVVTSYDP